jgi:hypothetical protein
MIALVATTHGSFSVDLATDEVEPWDGDVVPAPPPSLNLPRLVAAAAAGSTVVAVVDTKPPLVISHDAAATWKESGRGLPRGRAVAIAEGAPDTIVYAARNRLYVTTDGGVFWRALPIELPEIGGVSIRD